MAGIFGDKPKVPVLPVLNLQAEAAKAISGTAANLPGAESLVAKENLFSQQQIEQMLSSVIPNYKAITGQVGKNIESELRGEIPADVQAAVQNSAAARSLGSGTAGSDFSRNLVARDLGITSLQMTDRGLLSAESWIAQAASIYEPSMDTVKRYAITPEQQATFDVEERNSQWEVQWLRNQVAALPDPTLNSIYQAIHQAGMAAISAYGGGGKGGGGGGGSTEVKDPAAPDALPQNLLSTTIEWYPGVQDVMDPGFDYGAQVSGADAAIASEDRTLASEFQYNPNQNVNIDTGWGSASMGDQLGGTSAVGLWGQ